MTLLRLRRLTDQFRQSLFFLPALCVLASITLAFTMVRVDRWLSSDQLPEILSTTVSSARVILSTVAGGTITAASVVFSLTLVAVQLASSQFSPRIVRGFLGDRFQQAVMGLVVGTFTYSLVVLRVVQEPLDTSSDATPFLPRISIVVAIVLAVASLLAVLGSIDHTAKSLRVGSLLDHVVGETVEAIETRFARFDDDEPSMQLDAPGVAPARVREPRRGDSVTSEHQSPPDALMLRADHAGWVTQISLDGIIEALPKGSTVRLVIAVGTYLVPGSLLASVWPVDDEQRHHVESELRQAIEVRTARTLRQDVSFGFLLLTDIAVKALSPGVNDPNTANESIVRMGTVLAALLQHSVGDPVLERDDRTVVSARDLATAEYVDALVEPVRRYASAEPVVLETLVRTLATVRSAALAGSGDRADVSCVDDQLARIAAALDGIESFEGRQKVRGALEEAELDRR